MGTDIKRVWTLALVVFLACSRTEPAAERYSSEVEFRSAERHGDDWSPKSFTFQLGDRRYSAVWGEGTPDPAATEIAFDLDEHYFLERVLFAPYEGDILLAVHESNNDSGMSYLARVTEAGEELWRQWVPFFMEATVVEGAAYVSGFGGVGRIGLDDGEYAWQHRGLYRTDRINVYEPPELVGDTAIFREWSRTDSTTKTFVLDRASGEIIWIDDPGPVERRPDPAEDPAAEGAAATAALPPVLGWLDARTAKLVRWRESRVPLVGPVAGTPRGDSLILRLRQQYRYAVAGAAEAFDDPAFRDAIMPRATRTGPDPQKVELAQAVRAFLAERGIHTYQAGGPSARPEDPVLYAAREASMAEWFGPFATEPMRALLAIWTREQERPVGSDGSLRVGLFELGRRVADTEQWLTRWPDAAGADSVAALHRRHLLMFLAGDPN